MSRERTKRVATPDDARDSPAPLRHARKHPDVRTTREGDSRWRRQRWRESTASLRFSGQLARARPRRGSRHRARTRIRALYLTVSHAPGKEASGEAPQARAHAIATPLSRNILSLSLSPTLLSPSPFASERYTRDKHAKLTQITTRRALDRLAAVRRDERSRMRRQSGARPSRFPPTRSSPVPLDPATPFRSLLRASLAFVRPRSASLARFPAVRESPRSLALSLRHSLFHPLFFSHARSSWLPPLPQQPLPSRSPLVP